LNADDLTHIALPERLAARISEAAELHSATALRGCLGELERLGDDGLRLANYLRGFLGRYDMDAIQRVIAPIAVHPVTDS
jgi:hypothetical protein